MKVRFRDEQIIAMIKEQEASEKTADVCWRHGISSATFYKYKSKYAGMEPSNAKRLRALEDENGKLKKLLAEQMFPSRDIAVQYPAGQRTTQYCETSIQRNGDARWEAESCSAFDGDPSGQPTTVARQAIWQSQICREGACDVLQMIDQRCGISRVLAMMPTREMQLSGSRGSGDGLVTVVSTS